MTALEVAESSKGDNMNNAKLFSISSKAFSFSAFVANYCYDMDRKNLMKGFVQTTFVPGVTDNNVLFAFEVAVRAEEDRPQGKVGTHCAVYSVYNRGNQEGSDKKYYVQNDLVMKFKPDDGSVTDEQCAKILQQFSDAKNLPVVTVYFLKDSRSLAGAVLNGVLSKQARLYCFKDF